MGNRASPSVVERALRDVEAMKMEPSKAVKIALEIGSKIGSTVVQLLRYGREAEMAHLGEDQDR